MGRTGVWTARLHTKPRRMLKQLQAEKVDVLKQALTSFACMRPWAMRLRDLLAAYGVSSHA